MVYGTASRAAFVHTDHVREFYLQSGGEYHALETVGGGSVAVEWFAGVGFRPLGLNLVGLGSHAPASADPTQVKGLASGCLAGFGMIAHLSTAAHTGILLVIGLVAAYPLVGDDLAPRRTIGLGGRTSILASTVIIRLGVHGSAVAIVLIPIALTGLGIGGRVLRRALIP